MGNKKFGIFALLVILLSVSEGECKSGWGSFFGGVVGGVVGSVTGNAIGKLAKPKPKPQYAYYYPQVPTYVSPPINNQQQLVPVAPITPVHVQNTQTAPGGVYQNVPAYPGQAPVMVVRNSSPISAFNFHPSVYGFIAIVTYLLGKGHRLIWY